MKKYRTQPKYKRRNKKHAKNSLEEQIKFQDYRRKKNRVEQSLPIKERKHKRELKNQYWNYKEVEAPENLSLVNNPEPVINFINKLKLHFDNKQKVYVRMTNVKQISHDAIVVLLAIMVRFSAMNIKFDGDFPEDRVAKKILNESGFFFQLFNKYKDEDRYNIQSQNSIHTHAWKNVDAVLSAKIIQKASLTVWGTERRCQGAQRVLLELMQNTNNHASFGKIGEKHWWLSVNHNEDKKTVSFSFIDFGVGVFESLRNKTPGSKFYKWKEKLRTRIKYGDDSDLLRHILEGKLHSIVAQEHYRGKGLPGIKEALNRNQISKLFVISNNVFGNIENDEYFLITPNFEGTFVYFELNSGNFNCNAINNN